MKPFTFLLLCSVMSCGPNEYPIMKVPGSGAVDLRLKADFQRFEELTGRSVPESELHFVAFSDEMTEAGVCQKRQIPTQQEWYNKRVIINYKIWKNSSRIIQEAILWHELIHCVLEVANHTDEPWVRDDDTITINIMSPTLLTSDFYRRDDFENQVTWWGLNHD